jgi:hypothetical protein
MVHKGQGILCTKAWTNTHGLALSTKLEAYSSNEAVRALLLGMLDHFARNNQ